MTVITKGLISEKKEGDKVPLVLPISLDGVDAAEKGGVRATGQQQQRLNERYHYILRNNRAAAKISSATTLCLLITALLVMTVGLFGGLYIYKQVSRPRYAKWRGWCNVPYYAESPSSASSSTAGEQDAMLYDTFLGPQKLQGPGSLLMNGKKTIDDDIDNIYGEIEPDAEYYPQTSSNVATASDFFREEFEIDLESEKYTKVEVPDFKNGRLGRFIHEFDSNKTAIVDQTGMRCFIMPLDRERILPPKSMYDMIEKMWKGYYTVNTKRVRESMRIVEPAIDDLTDFGEYIQQECQGKTTYLLEKMTGRVFKKRSVSAQPHEVPFTEFAGVYTIDYDIVNLDQIEKKSR